MQNFTYHTHNHEQDFDGHQSAEEMIAAAEEKGFAEIGVSNHLICHKNLRIENGYQPMFRQDFKSGEECYKKHIELIRQAAEKHRIKVRVGFEVDFFRRHIGVIILKKCSKIWTLIILLVQRILSARQTRVFCAIFII